jgi:hypothetical protein
MDGHRSGVAFNRREPETRSTSALELVASDFETLVRVLELHETQYGDQLDLSVTNAKRAAERGLALCNQLLGLPERD